MAVSAPGRTPVRVRTMRHFAYGPAVKASWRNLVSRWRRYRARQQGLMPEEWPAAVAALCGHGDGPNGGPVEGRNIFPAIEAKL